MKLKIIVALIILVLASGYFVWNRGTSDAKRQLSSKVTTVYYEPEIVNLSGSLVLEKYNDITSGIVNVHILLLASPINVEAKPKDETGFYGAYSNVTKIQISTDKNIKNLIGKNVTIKGTLFGAHTAHHFTDVVVTVQDLSEKKDGI